MDLDITIKYYALRGAVQVCKKVIDTVDGPRQRASLDLQKRSIFHPLHTTLKVDLHSVAFPPKFGPRSMHFKQESILEYWAKNKFDEEKQAGLLTVGEYILLRVMDGSVPLELTLREIRDIFEKRIEIPEGTPVKIGQTKLELSAQQLMKTATKIQLEFEDNQLSGIEKYNALIKILSKLEGTLRSYMSYICELHFSGPIEHLAMSADIANIRYVVQKFKPLNMIQLTHKLCSSPTWQGKVTALVSLIELFEIDMMRLMTVSISFLANVILKVVSFVVENTEIGITYLKKAFKWVTPKDDSEPELQANEIYATCSTHRCGKPTISGCSLCCMHWCSSCVACQCPIEFHHTNENCLCENNNDCWWRALGARLGKSVTELKRDMLLFLTEDRSRNKIQDWVDYFGIEKFGHSVDQILKRTRDSLHVHQMAENDTILASAICFDLNIMLKHVVGQTTTRRVMKFRRYAPWFWVQLQNTHYTHLTGDASFAAESNIFGGLIQQWTTPSVTSEGSDSTKSEVDYCDDESIKQQYEPKCPYVQIREGNLTDVFFKNAEILGEYIKQIEIQDARDANLAKDLQDTAVKNVTHEVFDVDSVSTFSSDLTDINADYINKQSPTDSQQTSSGTLSDNGEETKEDVVDGARKCAENMQNKVNAKKTRLSFSEWFKSTNLSHIFENIQNWLKNASVDIIKWFDENPLFSGIFAIIAGIASFFGLYTNIPTTKEGFGGIIDKFNGATRTMHYAKSGFQGIVNAMTDTFGEIRNFLGCAKDKDIMDFKERVGSMLVLCKEMLQQAQTHPAQFINNGSRYLEFKQNMKDVMKCYQELTKLRGRESASMNVLTPIWYNLTRTYESLTNLYVKFSNGSATRKVPTCIWLWGATGIGKSAMITQMCNDLNKRLNKEMKIFTVSKGNDFWNNFAQQEIIRFDDFNAVMGPDGDLESAMLMNLVTDAPFNPNQAALEDKNTMCNPSFVICASNSPSLPQNTIITDVQAWESRRHKVIHVSYPEHEEKCRIRDITCEHFKDKTPDKFDHLTFLDVNPVMSDQERTTNRGRTVTHVKTAPDDKIVADGFATTYDRIINELIERDKIHQETYERTLKNAMEAGTAFKMQALEYEDHPTIALVGPPGTGKSRIFEMLSAKYRDECLHIKTEADLQIFVDLHKSGKMPKRAVILDDCSHFLLDPSRRVLLDTFLAIVQERYDSPKENLSYMLYIGVNKEMFIAEKSSELFDQLFRRCAVMQTSFNPMSWKDKNVKTLGVKNIFKSHQYDHTWVKADPSRINDFVTYKFKGKNYLQCSIVDILFEYRPKVVEYQPLTEIPIANSTQATCMAIINLSADDMLRSINDYDITGLLKLLMVSNVKTSKTSSFTKKKFFTAVADLCRKCKRAEPRAFPTLDDIFLQAYNSKFLEFLKGECAVLKLRDYAIFVDYLGSEPKLGKMLNPNQDLSNLVKDLSEMTSMATKGLVDSLSFSMLPPWVLLASEAITAAMTWIITGGAIVLGVADQERMFKAYRSDIQIDKVLDAAKEAHNRKAGDILMKNNKIYPGLGHPSSPQYGVCDDVKTAYYDPEPEGWSDSGTKRKDNHGRVRREVDSEEEEGWSDGGEKRGKKQMVKRESKKRLRRSPAKRVKSVNITPTANPLQSTCVQSEYYERPFKNVTKTAPIMESDEKIEFQMSRTGDPLNYDEDVVVQQVCVDPTLYSMVNMVFKNTCEIITRTGKRLCSGLFVGGTTVRTVRHILDHERDLLVRDMAKKVWNCRVKYEDDFIDRLDLEIIDPHFPARRNIIDHFPPQSMHVVEGQLAVLITPDFTREENIVSYSLRTYMLKNYVYKDFTSLGKKYQVLDYRGHKAGFRTEGPIQTTYGDCGSILIICNPNYTKGKVVGMHIAATTTAGFASPLWNEQYNNVELQCVLNTADLDKRYYVEDDCEYPYVGKTKTKNYLSAKTRLFRNYFPHGEKAYEPSILSSSDPRCKNESMLFKEAEKWLEEPSPIAPEMKTVLWKAMDEIAHHVVDVFATHGKKLRVLTKTESLNKLSESNHSEPINTHTSAGYPFNTMSDKPGKADWISILPDGSRRFNNSDLTKKNFLLNEVDKLLTEHKTMKNKTVAFQVFLKDEAVKLSKIYCEPEKQKTRTIAAAPLDFQIAYRMYFHSCHAALMDLFDVLPIKVGINPLSMSWHDLFMQLAGKSDKVLSSDFAGWDFSHHPFFVDLLNHFYNVVYMNLDPSYEVEHAQIRSVLMSKVSNFVMIIGSSVAQAQRGIPSGYPGTSPDNSLINWCLSVAAWSLIMSKVNPALANLYGYMEDVCPAIYSDDKVEAIRPWALQYYNGLTIPSIVKQLGFNMQPASKDGDFTESHHVKESVFLSRGFKMYNGIWLGPLKKDRLLKTTWFIHDTKTHYWFDEQDELCSNPESVVGSWESILYEASLHGRTFFEELRVSALKVYELFPLRFPPTYEQCLSRMFGCGELHAAKKIESYTATPSIMEAAKCVQARPAHFKIYANRESWSYGVKYDYNGGPKTNAPTSGVRELLTLVNTYFQLDFNNVHVNKYPPGGEIPWHKDDEPGLVPQYPIVGLTLYGDGRLDFKGADEFSVFQGPGLMYKMTGFLLTDYKHRRTMHTIESMSLTFRRLIPQ